MNAGVLTKQSAIELTKGRDFSHKLMSLGVFSHSCVLPTCWVQWQTP